MPNAKKYCRGGLTIHYNPEFPAAQLLLSAHGCQGGTPFIIPLYTQIWFYCPDGTALRDINVLNFSKLDTHPYEIYSSGASCPNYDLSNFEDPDEMVDLSPVWFGSWVKAKNQDMENFGSLPETRPVALATIDKRPWYSFNSMTLKDVVMQLEQESSEFSYSAILCAFCRCSSLTLFKPSGHDCISNLEKNIRTYSAPK
ncbi:hypothetical protein D5R81_19555 [Parashewanella spongiae]|uniref:Putative adhesin Stv domain-containing protein n=1 Tax=Parashewanella spongiae TaxID=342950 RepID=A0A3A6TAW8_9GAMM|nr:hypothetical protein [Parashewanella spongiae]MCL1080218.1 hypothetical protein [Parashewanella spongiae]RJY02115.1 hypothetical protein D5R81_19555 [Parashewanella spongiae]